MSNILHIWRGQSTPEGTFGRAEFSNGLDIFKLHSLELPWKNNARGWSSIITGEYNAGLFISPKFKRQVFLLENVPGRDMIEIHPANWAGDAEIGYYCELNGCIALGTGKAPLVTPRGNRQMALRNSGAALDMVIDGLRGDRRLKVVIEETIA